MLNTTTSMVLVPAVVALLRRQPLLEAGKLGVVKVVVWLHFTGLGIVCKIHGGCALARRETSMYHVMMNCNSRQNTTLKSLWVNASHLSQGVSISTF